METNVFRSFVRSVVRSFFRWKTDRSMCVRRVSFRFGSAGVHLAFVGRSVDRVRRRPSGLGVGKTAEMGNQGEGVASRRVGRVESRFWGCGACRVCNLCRLILYLREWSVRQDEMVCAESLF